MPGRRRTSSRFWATPLARWLARRLAAERPPRIAIVGVGQELRGDDTAGLALVHALRPRLSGRDDVLLLDAGPSPENVTGALRRFAPEVVLLVDAAALGVEAGATRALEWRETGGVSATTHTLPVRLVAGFLEAELGCEVLLLGIQAASTGVGMPLSAAVRLAVQREARALARLLAVGGAEGGGGGAQRARPAGTPERSGSAGAGAAAGRWRRYTNR